MDPGREYPLLCAFHGHGGNADDFKHFAHEMCVDIGECIGVVPNGHEDAATGIPRSWNCGNKETESHADEPMFIVFIVEHLAQYKQVDSARSFAVGHSNGACLVHQVVAHTNIFGGIGAFASMLIHGRPMPGASNRKVAVFQVHGVKDDVIPYEGGPSPVGHDFVSAEETVRLWAEHNRCQLDPLIATTALGNRRIEYVGCAGGALRSS